MIYWDVKRLNATAQNYRYMCHRLILYIANRATLRPWIDLCYLILRWSKWACTLLMHDCTSLQCWFPFYRTVRSNPLPFYQTRRHLDVEIHLESHCIAQFFDNPNERREPYLYYESISLRSLIFLRSNSEDPNFLPTTYPLFTSWKNARYKNTLNYQTNAWPISSAGRAQ